MARVSACRKPVRWVPPSCVLMLLTKEKTVSWYASLYCSATSIWTPSFSPSTSTGLAWIGVLFWFRCCTKETMPPLYWKSWDLSFRSSTMEILRPAFRNDSSRSRWERTSKENSVSVKISVSGLKVIFVPFLRDFPVTFSGDTVSPRTKSIWCTDPSRRISAVSVSERAFTTETPTPCSPPDTLYVSRSNFPPACRIVRTTSAADFPSSGMMSTGIPRPLSSTVIESSAWMATVMVSQYPAIASSIALSTTS